MARCGDSSWTEEVVAAFQGIICRKELLPAVEKIRY